MQLRGPGNDVALMATLLCERFGFPAANVSMLSESAGPDRLPTRSNIAHEMQHLAERVADGDQVVLLLAGHGSQQPDVTHDPLDDYEPDGLDELFLPRDIQGWDATTGAVTNAIVDDELRAWLQSITSKGASLWVIVDSCHSGTMIRDVGDEQARHVPMSLLIPADAIKETQGAARLDTDVSTNRAKEVAGLVKAGGIVAFYAAQPHEPTVEKTLPPDANPRTRYGLLTYTLNQVLMQASAPITYRELAQRIHEHYAASGRTSPTPLIEGSDCDREVLGSLNWAQRSRIMLSTDSHRGRTVNAGAIHGLTVGSKLAIFAAPRSTAGDPPVAYARVESVSPLHSRVVPCPHAGRAAEAQLPEVGRCEIIERDYGSMRLLCSVTPVGLRADHPSVVSSGATLRQLATIPESMLEQTDDPDRADYLLRVDERSAYLVAAGSSEGESRAPSAVPADEATWLGPVPLDNQFATWLATRLQRICRVRSLMKLSSNETLSEAGGGLDVEMQMLRSTNTTTTPDQIVTWDSGRLLKDGDVVAFRILNRGEKPIDATLLFIDSTFGITQFFPKPGLPVDARLLPDQEITTPNARVTSSGAAEHMLLIAVEAKPESLPIDFSPLWQSSVSFRDGAETRSLATSSITPLHRLLRGGERAADRHRSIAKDEAEAFAIRIITWAVTPR